MEGMFIYNHTILVIDHEGESEDGFLRIDVDDVIKIKAIDKTKIKFELESWFMNAHSCGLDGVAEKKGNKFVYTSTDDWNGNTCELEISLDKENGIVLKDQNYACASMACGMRGSLDGATFPEKN
ncbi:MAG: hypothetical protein ACJAT2_000698 [Bacteriovoracaceae bacterium]|jgi:hypothetical protein